MKSKRMMLVLTLAIVLCIALALSLTACQKYCTVLFEEEGVASQTVVVGGKATRPMVEKGDMRVEWYTDEQLTSIFDFETEIKEDITLYPKWISVAPATITVTFKSDGAVVKTETVVKGEGFNPVFLAKANKTLDRWVVEGETTAFDFDAGAQQNITLVAVWSDTRGIYNVTFSNEDSQMSVAVGANGKVFAPHVSEKEGYEFKGWFLPEGEVAFDFANTVIESDLTLTARWEEKEYTVSFFDWDGKLLQEVKVNHGESAAILANTPTHRYSYFYSFSGWQSDADLTNITKNSEATAQYSANYLPEEMLAFDLRHDGTYAVRLKNNAETDYSHYNIAQYCVLPETYNGKPVTMVQNQGFMPKKALVFDGEIHLLVPSTYEIVGGQAFESFSGVEIVLAEGVREIWNRAFGDQMFYNIKLSLPSTLTLIEYWSITFGNFQIELTDGAHYISDEKGIWTADRKELSYIHNKDSISEFVVPEGTEYIAPAVFAYTSIESVTFEGAVKGIGGDNFIGNEFLSSVVFMDTVERVESGDDYDYNLNYWIEDDVIRHDIFTSLWYSASFVGLYIENFVLPNGLKYIGQCCFNNVNIEEINLDGIEYIGKGTFAFIMEGQPKLKKVSVTNSQNYYSHEGVALVARGQGVNGGDMIMMYATQNQVAEYTTPTTVTTIDSFSFRAKYLTKLTISEGCLEILGSAIEFFPQVPGQAGPAATVLLPESLQTLSSELSMDYWGYNDVTDTTEPSIRLWHGKLIFPQSCTIAEIDSRTIAVSKQYSEESFVIPASLTNFGDGFGVSNIRVKNYTVEEGNTNFVAFDGWLYKKISPTKLRLVAVPRLTEKIVDGELVFPQTPGYTLIEIGNYVFYGFTESTYLGLRGITRVVIPQGVEKIGYQAFSTCENIVSITLPESLREIGANAFQELESLEEVVFESDLPPTFGKQDRMTWSAFCDSWGYYDEASDQYIEGMGLPEKCKLYVPDMAVDIYKIALGNHALQEDGKDTYSAKVFKISERVA